MQGNVDDSQGNRMKGKCNGYAGPSALPALDWHPKPRAMPWAGIAARLRRSVLLITLACFRSQMQYGIGVRDCSTELQYGIAVWIGVKQIHAIALRFDPQ
jgi:hypothetical protein